MADESGQDVPMLDESVEGLEPATIAKTNYVPNEFELKRHVEQFVDVLFLHCQAFEQSDQEDWPSAVACCEKLNMYVKGDNADDSLQDAPDWKQDSCHLLKMAVRNHNRDPQRDRDLWQYLCESIERLTLGPEFETDMSAHKHDQITIQNRHREVLQYVWERCTIAKLEDMLKEIGPQKVEKLLGSLCVRIRCDSAGDTFKWYRDSVSPIRMVPGSFGKGPDQTVDHFKRRITSDLFLSSVRVYYTEVKFLLENDASKAEDDSSPATILSLSQAISNSGSQGDQYNQYATPFGQAITNRIWNSALPYFLLGRLWDVILQVLLSWFVAPVSHSLRLDDVEKLHRQNLDWPSRCLLVALAVFGSRGILTTLLDVLVSFRMGLQSEFGRALLSPFIWLNLSMEVFSCYFASCMCNDYWQSQSITGMSNEEVVQLWEGTYLHKHPAHVFSLIWLKWFQLLLMVMNFDMILQYVLPVWAAISSPRSVVFLSYMVMLSVGTMLAYYSLPVDSESGFTGYFMALYRMCSLDLLGQFDDNDMEGVDLEVNEDGKIVRPDEHSEFYIAIKVATIGIGILFPVILLNMYVGVLSAEHDKVMKRIVHVSGVYRSRATFQLLLGRKVWQVEQRFARMTRKLRECWLKVSRKPFPEEDQAEGIFIYIPYDLIDEYESSPMFVEVPQAQDSRLDKLHTILRKFEVDHSLEKDEKVRLQRDVAGIKAKLGKVLDKLDVDKQD